MIWDFQNLLSKRLLIWGALSILAGCLIIQLSGSVFWRGFGLQAVVWGFIDALISGFGLRGSYQKIHEPVIDAEIHKAKSKLRKILLINTVLDILYIAAGLLVVMIPGIHQEFIRGTGWGIILQGGFLFVFDLIHWVNTPEEPLIPDFGIFDSPIHQPITVGNGRGAVLLVHGFPGSPAEMHPLGAGLEETGWTVRYLCLPGHGSEISRLFSTRAVDWQSKVEAELQELKQKYSPVLLIGYSLGGGLSIAASTQVKPDAAVFLAPFWLDLPVLLSTLLDISRPFLPAAFRPFRWINPDTPQLRVAVSELLPGFDYNRPDFREKLKNLSIPLIFLEQFRLLSRKVRAGIAAIDYPVIIIQGKDDQVVRATATRKLVQKMAPDTRYIEISGDHNLNLRSHPSFEMVQKLVVDFCQEYKYENSE